MNIKDVEHLAELAKIELPEEEKQEILKDMESILAYVKVIESVEVGDVKMEYSVKNVWREDLPEPRDFSHDLVVGQFPKAKDDFLQVKKIL